MNKTIILYGLSLAVLALLLNWIDYRFWLRDISLEVYVGLIGIICISLGIWMGLRLTKRSGTDKNKPPTTLEQPAAQIIEESGLSPREYEVLQLMAEGLSNQEIADKLFISLNTVKTHSSNLFVKLEVKRRTQAVQQARAKGLLPGLPPKDDAGGAAANHPKV